MAAEESRLSRWARRKAETRRKEERKAAEPPAEAPPPALPALADAEDAAEAVAPEDLPDIETLTADSDFTVFMRKGVPEILKRAALRKLWLSDPIFNFQDGLVEYGEDYTDAARVIPGMQSAWRAGTGYLRPEAAEPASGDDAAVEAQPGEETPVEPEDDADGTPPNEPPAAGG